MDITRAYLTSHCVAQGVVFALHELHTESGIYRCCNQIVGGWLAERALGTRLDLNEHSNIHVAESKEVEEQE